MNQNKTRILTWNVGLFSWFKYAHLFGCRLNGDKIQHEYFQNTHTVLVSEEIKKINPDICVLQEFYTTEDVSLVVEKLKDLYPYHKTISTWYHEHSILVLSKSPLEGGMLGNSEFNVLKTSQLSFIPIHLNSFSASKRLKQVESLLEEIKDFNVDCILGDTNFWTVGSGNRFFFKKDKTAYEKLRGKLEDTSKTLGSTTKMYLNFDKIFIKKGLNFSNPSCVRKNGKYMDHFPVFVEVFNLERSH